MLTCLRVRQLAIIDELEVELGPGLNVVTGETGAGKSILVTALQLVLGARARPELVRTGAERAEVEALFEVEPEASRDRLAELGLDEAGEILVRRVVLPSGRSRAYINGQIATKGQLERLAAGLVDISSQHQHHTLVDVATHLSYLDAFAGLDAERDQTAAHVAVATSALRDLREARSRAAGRLEREGFLRFQLEDLARIDPRPGEEDALHEEHDRLHHAARLSSSADDAHQELSGRDKAISGRLERIASQLEGLAEIDRQLAPLAERVASTRIELDDVAQELATYSRRLRADPRRLAEVEDRLQALRRLARRHGGSLDAALAWRAEAEAELAELDAIEEVLARREQALDEAVASAATAARALSRRRQEAAARLAAAIETELVALGMGAAQVRVDVAPLDGADSELQVDGARLTRTGVDRVEFRIAPNPGEAPRPLAQVASGGELSRALLGLKRVLAGLGPKGLYVFDEVDAGVGGGIAEVIGRKIAEVSAHHQVLCITHLPQIAAFADLHLLVHKAVRDGRTHSAIDPLDPRGRRDELARMLGGLEISDTTRRVAEEMLVAARPA